MLSTTGSHAMLDVLFKSAGAPGGPPDLSHGSKWKEWLFRAGIDLDTDSLAILGNVLEEFMDVPPDPNEEEFAEWKQHRERIEKVLEENGFRYFRFGRILPQEHRPATHEAQFNQMNSTEPVKPHQVEEFLYEQYSTGCYGMENLLNLLKLRRNKNLNAGILVVFRVLNFYFNEEIE